jgi:hypothetical protein
MLAERLQLPVDLTDLSERRPVTPDERADVLSPGPQEVRVYAAAAGRAPAGEAAASFELS